jgi:hypothetical protein
MKDFYAQIYDGRSAARQEAAAQAQAQADAASQPVPVHLPLRYQPRPGESPIAYARRIQPILAHLELQPEETQIAVQLAYEQATAAIEQIEREVQAQQAAGTSWLSQRAAGSGVGIFGRDEDVVGRVGRGNYGGGPVVGGL